MSLRDYYRCKKCDDKIAYGPDRPDDDWEPFLLCRDCLAALELARHQLRTHLVTIYQQVTNGRLCYFGDHTGYEPQIGSNQTEQWKTLIGDEK